MPRTKDRAEDQKVEEMITCLNCPNLESMPGKQFVYKICWRHKTKPQHKTGQGTGGGCCTAHQVDQQCNRHGLNKRSDESEYVDAWVRIVHLSRLADPFPPGRVEQFWMIPNEPTDHRDHDTNNDSQPVD